MNITSAVQNGFESRMVEMHKPVLVREIREIMQFRSDNIYVDCTIGAGGLAYHILSDSSPTGRLVGLDLDCEALKIARHRLSEFGDRLILVHGNYKDLQDILQDYGVEEVNGIVMDLGVSSLQLNIPERGFSFQKDGPLDMRMNAKQSRTARDLISDLDARQLKELFEKYGEEKYALKIAKAIVKARKKEAISTTLQLARLIEVSVPHRGSHYPIHPATRVFQALRIAVNDELTSLMSGLPAAISVMKPGGRIALISFHSLEDRIVKEFFRKMEKGCICPPDFPRCNCGRQSQLKILTKKPITPGLPEKKDNPRSRSAKLRAAEKLVSS